MRRRSTPARDRSRLRAPLDPAAHGSSAAHWCWTDRRRSQGELRRAARPGMQVGLETSSSGKPLYPVRARAYRARRPRICSVAAMFDVRACTDQDEYSRAVGAIGQYFNPPPSEELLELFTRTLPHERMHAAWEDGQIVGGAGAFPFELSVPGGSLPCAGITAVGVHPTHRRRGVLRSMMDAQLRDVHERGEPIAALWASEETIYSRFGYGIASWAGELKVQH